MHPIKIEKAFHPVGHGCFYSEKFYCEHELKTIVFDCGAVPYKKLNEKITKFGKGTIDLLILSHFHKDHINGIIQLKKTCEIKNVIIPKLSLTDIAFYIATGNTISRILFNINNFWGKTRIISLNDKSDNIGIYNLEDLPNSINSKASIQVNRSWIIKFYLDKISLNNLSIHSNEFIEDLNEIGKIISQTEKIKDIYKRSNSNINLTSISMYSRFYFDREQCDIVIPVTVINGDANLKGNYFKKLLNHFNDIKNDQIEFVLPHHGSKYNIDLPIEFLNITGYYAFESRVRKCRYLHWINDKLIEVKNKIKIITEDDNDYIEKYGCENCSNSQNGVCLFSSI